MNLLRGRLEAKWVHLFVCLPLLSYRIWESAAPVSAMPGIASDTDSAGDELFSPSASPIPGSGPPARWDE